MLRFSNAVVFIVLCSSAMAQVSPEEARQKLEERQRQREAAAAEQVTITRGELGEMRATVERQAMQIASLRAELAEMRAKDAERVATEEAGRKQAADIRLRTAPERPLAKGMTYGEVVAKLGSPTRKTTYESGAMRCEWVKRTPEVSGELGDGMSTGGSPGRVSTVVNFGADGRVTAFAIEE